ncbi:hypothetical protein CMK11_19145 [Candidatus Poribacteria bacterium]|nr:hypothetical protein [Candidatus Poribacteria bacterium]
MGLIPAYVEQFVRGHLVIVGAAWAYLLAGSLFAAGVVWGRRRSGLGRGRFLGWLTQLVPPLAALLAFSKRAPAPLKSPFGEVRLLGEAGQMLPRGSVSSVRLRRIPPIRMLLASFLGGIVPGFGQLVHLRVGRAVVLWAFTGFALVFIAAHQLGIERTWAIPDWLLPASKRGQDATANFRVPGYFFALMLAEFGAFLLWSFLDLVGLNDAYAEKRARGGEGGPRLFYNIAVDRAGSDSQRFGAEKESIAVGTAPVCDHIVAGDLVLPEHVLFYVHHVDVSALTVQFRCLGEESTVAHNGVMAREGAIRPGDTIQVGDTSFRFLPIE